MGLLLQTNPVEFSTGEVVAFYLLLLLLASMLLILVLFI
jgi:hypothetical protein